MEPIKVLSDSDNQIVFLPKSCRLSGEEFIAGKLGDAVLLVPKEKAWETFLNGLNGFSDDFMADEIETDVPTERDAS